jgi:hypothetical protein
MPSFIKLGIVIASRELEAGGNKKITIKIGKPRREVDHESYFCPYQILGIGYDKLRRAAGGLDSIQAIQLAFQKIGIDLYILNKANNGALNWDGGEHGDLGFPLPDNILDILRG